VRGWLLWELPVAAQADWEIALLRQADAGLQI
jgi:hypothetical protein